ncbi:MAG: hypothetical protein RDV48_25925 [Candidatus Eremiobacteraeota bacterium]|nr:hypothetical protein [Candidatus Eremiobacteraeota bacterium]
MDPLSGIQGFNNDILMQALKMSTSMATAPMNIMSQLAESSPGDGTMFSQDLQDGEGGATNLSLVQDGQSKPMGYNGGSGMVPGFGGFLPGMSGMSGMMGMGGSSQMMMMMMMMLMQMMQMMQSMGSQYGNNGMQQSNNANFGNPINMSQNQGSWATAYAGNGQSYAASGTYPANTGNYFPNMYNNPNVNMQNMYSSGLNGTLGLNGMNLGQGVNSGGGNVYNPNMQFDDIMDGFNQGTEGNCASIAVIKAAMDKYGTGVFQDVQKTADGGYNVKLRDGRDVQLTAQEYQTAQQMAGFEGKGGDEQQFATLCYGVMAKGALAENNEGCKDYMGACKSLNDGEWPNDTARYMGLQNDMMPLDPQNLGGQDGVVGWNTKHAIYMDNQGGNLMSDHYGEAYNYDGTDTFNRQLTDAFTFKA